MVLTRGTDYETAVFVIISHHLPTRLYLVLLEMVFRCSSLIYNNIMEARITITFIRSKLSVIGQAVIFIVTIGTLSI